MGLSLEVVEFSAMFVTFSPHGQGRRSSPLPASSAPSSILDFYVGAGVHGHGRGPQAGQRGANGRNKL